MFLAFLRFYFGFIKKEREISLKKAVGASNISIYCELYIQILFISLVAMLLVFSGVRNVFWNNSYVFSDILIKTVNTICIGM
ncbi:FtsX-like permease family protein [Bacillus cereus]